METIQINPIKHFEVVQGTQKVDLSIEEIRNLAKAAGITSVAPMPAVQKRTSTPKDNQVNVNKPKKTWGISQEKKERILVQVRKNLTAQPQSLSKLLKGAKYAPNDLPKLREHIEAQPDIQRMSAGKLTYYFSAPSGAAQPQPQRGDHQQQQLSTSTTA